MKEQLINDVCMMFSRAVEGIDLNTVRNILTLALSDCEVTKYTKALTIYEGDSNEKIIKAFLVAKRVNGASDKTVKHYDFILNQFFKKIGIHAAEVRPNDIRIYFARRELDDHVTDVTRNNERAVLNSFYQWLTDEELIEKNPMRKIPKIKQKKIQRKAFTQMELERIRANCKNELETAVIEVLISTGCRVSELCGIKLADIDGDRITVHGKGGKDRAVYLTAKAQLAIDEYMQTEHFKKRHRNGGDFLFVGKNYRNGEGEKPAGASAIQCMTKRIGKDAGVTNVHPHRFRRTCATLALERGMPIERVSHMLGHESIDTTQVYLDLNERGMQEAHRKFVC